MTLTLQPFAFNGKLYSLRDVTHKKRGPWMGWGDKESPKVFPHSRFDEKKNRSEIQKTRNQRGPEREAEWRWSWGGEGTGGGVNQKERKRGAREGKIRERSGKERGKGNRELDSFSRFFDPRHVHFIRANLRFTKIGLPHTTFSLSESRTIHRLTDSSSFASPMRRN